MKEFFRTRSYDMLKMFLNQFGTAIFGVSLAIVAGKAQNVVLRNVTSAFAVLFYLFLLYTMTWEIGFKDKVSVETGRKKYAPLTGFWISLCANLPNLLFALLISLAIWFDVPFLSTLGGFASTAALLLEGMYTGLLANTVGGVALNSHWWMWFLITVPSMAVCGLSYYFGVKDIKFTGLFKVQYPASDRDPKPPKKK